MLSRANFFAKNQPVRASPVIGAILVKYSLVVFDDVIVVMFTDNFVEFGANSFIYWIGRVIAI